MKPRELGIVVYQGPSLLNGDRIVGVLTGLDGGSANPKTGPMAQAWVLLEDVEPMEAKRQDLDVAICGDCPLRGRGGQDIGCYVTVWQGARQVWNRYKAGGYPIATPPQQVAAVEGQALRLAAYGDPAAVPFEVWQLLVHAAAGWVAYTHQWRTCDKRFRAIAMASVDTENEFIAAHLAGWRTFRWRRPGAPLMEFGAPLEFVCPASEESNFRATCLDCQLCQGASSPARSVAIRVHGKPSNLQALGVPTTFFRSRDELAAELEA